MASNVAAFSLDGIPDRALTLSWGVIICSNTDLAFAGFVMSIAVLTSGANLTSTTAVVSLDIAFKTVALSSGFAAVSTAARAFVGIISNAFLLFSSGIATNAAHFAVGDAAAEELPSASSVACIS
jgi:hypothetical protein